MKINAQNYLNEVVGHLRIFSQETRTSYLTALGLIFTVNVSILVGSITLSDKLNLDKTLMAQDLACVSWALLGISTFLLAFAILIFLVQQSMEIVEEIKNCKLAMEALKVGKEELVVKDRPLFMRYLIAFLGFLGFILGLLNILLAIFSPFMHICWLTVILCNIILTVLSIVVIAPMIKNNRPINKIMEQE